MALIYKICPITLWQEAERSGTFTGAPVDVADGFIHFSTGDQVAETAAKHFAGMADLLLVVVDSDRLGPSLRYEPSRGGALFPHLYGPMPLTAVAWVTPLPLGPEGAHVLPVLDPASQERATFDPAAAGWERLAVGEGLIATIGPLWTKTDALGPLCGLLLERRHQNRSGNAHGGIIMTLADQALALIAWSIDGGVPHATVQLDTAFVGPSKPGDFLQGRGRIVRQTRSLLFMGAEIKVEERLVATATAILKRLRS